MLLKKDFFINLLIASIPLAYIAGNLLLNINILLIIIFSLGFYKLKIFHIQFSSIDKLILVFFFYIILNGIVNSNLQDDNSSAILAKSLGYLRFLILYLTLKFLITENKINYKLIFISFGSVSLFVALDVTIQYFFGKDIFGYTIQPTQRRLGGPFGDELSAGSFVQRFYIFALYFLIIFSKLKESSRLNAVIIFLMSLFLMGVLLAGNRVPLVMFFLSIILFFILEKVFRKKSLLIFLIFLIIFSIPLSMHKKAWYHYAGFVVKSVETTNYIIKRFNYFNSEKLDYIPNSYAKEFETGILTWKQNKFFGGGIKSFYFNCKKIKNSIMDKYGGTNCNSHPHNYYLHISTELGLVGLFLIISIFSLIIVKSLKMILVSKNLHLEKTLIPFFIVFIAEIFPLKTSGSFFTSANSTFLFIIISFIVGLIQLREKDDYVSK
tara:strand:+ start:3885 stop:5195 length:1311 start_codon:yes stop_codon:yes gene_type:complete